MIPWSDIAAALFLAGGLFFLVLGAVGIVRMPDTYLRLHAASKSSTLGLIGLLLGAVFHIGTADVITKGAITLVFAAVATPVGSHLLAKAALRAGPGLWDKTLTNEHAEDRAH
jgi:multicomponent Na+:H+ antiporter subunit G